MLRVLLNAWVTKTTAAEILARPEGGFELMAIAGWRPFKTRRRVADFVRETI